MGQVLLRIGTGFWSNSMKIWARLSGQVVPRVRSFLRQFLVKMNDDLTLYFVLEYYFYFHRIPIGSILNFVLNLTVYNIASKTTNQKPVFITNNVPYEAVLESAVNSQSLPFFKKSLWSLVHSKMNFWLSSNYIHKKYY